MRLVRCGCCDKVVRHGLLHSHVCFARPGDESRHGTDLDPVAAGTDGLCWCTALQRAADAAQAARMVAAQASEGTLAVQGFHDFVHGTAPQGGAISGTMTAHDRPDASPYAPFASGPPGIQMLQAEALVAQVVAHRAKNSTGGRPRLG